MWALRISGHLDWAKDLWQPYKGGYPLGSNIKEMPTPWLGIKN